MRRSRRRRVRERDEWDNNCFVAVAYKLYKLCLIEIAAAVALATHSRWQAVWQRPLLPLPTKKKLAWLWQQQRQQQQKGMKSALECVRLCYTRSKADQNHFLNFCCILSSALEMSSSSNCFLNNFYVTYAIATKFTEVIGALMVIVLTKNELNCIRIALGI